MEKWLSEEALQIAEKRREPKGKVENERYEFRVPKNSKDIKTFLRDQCKEIEENNRMGKTRDLFQLLYLQIFFLSPFVLLILGPPRM